MNPWKEFLVYAAHVLREQFLARDVRYHEAELASAQVRLAYFDTYVKRMVNLIDGKCPTCGRVHEERMVH